jgi:apolipoprotein N-acyltransferase
VFGITGLLLAALFIYWPPLPPTPAEATVHVAGVQTERWDDSAIADALDRLAKLHPEAQILVLSEDAFSEAVPDEVRRVLRKHNRYLIAGGSMPIEGGGFYNTAFVVGPDGRDIFSQAKSVPVQFLNDGVPAPERHVWDSPWGKIGIAICYDASYSRVMDDFVRQGARGLIIPTMDVTSWGEFERRMLHGRVQPVRSAEYGIPTFGVWSSGVSQLTDRYGRVVATAGYPGQGDVISGGFDLSRPGRIPPDRLLAQASMLGSACFIVYCLTRWRPHGRRNGRAPASAPISGDSQR